MRKICQHSVAVLACRLAWRRATLSELNSQASSPRCCSMGFACRAEILASPGGVAKVMVQASNSSHARQILELQYGRGRVMNLHQR